MSGMAEAKAVKFCTQWDYIKSCHKDYKSLPKGAWLGSRDAFIACTSLDLQKIRHSTSLTEVNNAVDGGPLFSNTYDGRRQWCYTQGQQTVRVVVDLLQTWL